MTAPMTACAGLSHAVTCTSPRPPSSVEPGSRTSTIRMMREVRRRGAALHDTGDLDRRAVEQAHAAAVGPLQAPVVDQRGLHAGDGLAARRTARRRAASVTRVSTRGSPTPCHSESSGSWTPGGNSSASGARSDVSGAPRKPSTSDSAARTTGAAMKPARGSGPTPEPHLAVAEGAPHEAGRVGRGEDRPDDHPDDEQPAARRTDPGAVAVAGDVDERDEHALLGDVADQRGETRHRRGGERRGDGEDRQPAGEAGQLAQVARAGLWSITPTTRNRVALNNACASSRASPASIALRVPVPRTRTRKPSWLTVP